MADFNFSFSLLDSFEGGYSNHPADKGGETIFGISRVFHPNWDGWKIFDKAKKLYNFPSNVEDNEHLKLLAKQFYKDVYWDSFNGDIYPQTLSNRLFNISINIGRSYAFSFLQQSLNLLINSNLTVDGIFGNETSSSLNSFLSDHDIRYLLKCLRIFQGYHYISISLEDPSQSVFIFGWLNRV